MLALAAYPGGAKRVVCDPDCLDGVDILDCDCEPYLLPCDTVAEAIYGHPVGFCIQYQ